MQGRTDIQLITDYREGDKKALDLLIANHFESIYRFIFRYVRNESQAEDLTQDTFIRVWKNISKFDTEKSFKPWLYTVARNITFDYLRKKNPTPFSVLEIDEDTIDFGEGDEKNSEALFDDVLMRDKIIGALQTLPPLYQNVVTLRYEEDLTFQEIADVFGESIDTIKSRYRRALQRLKETLKDAAPNNNYKP